MKTYQVIDLQKQGHILVEDGNHGEYRPRRHEFVSNGVAFIRAADLGNGRITFESASKINQDAHQRIRKGIGKGGDVILSHKGTIGKVAFTPFVAPSFVCSPQTTFWRSLNKNFINPRYLYYFLRSPSFQNQLLAVQNETDMAGYVSLTNQRRLKVIVPSITTQRAIAHILGTLDDKIELNRQMNQTLEAIARALFKSWFIDFDPVHANHNATPYPLDAATLALFPNHFEESQYGRIPAGWQVEPIGEHISAMKGLSYKGSGLSDVGMPLHNLNSIYEGGGYKYSGIKYYTGEYKDRHIIKTGDVIVANTEQGFDRLLIGYPAIVPNFYGDSGIFSHHLYRIRAKQKSPLTNHYLYFLFAANYYHGTITGYTNGTTVNMLPPDSLQKPLIIVPPENIAQQFEKIVAPIVSQQQANYAESQTLAELRDTLLPQLISGKLRVPDAAKVVETTP